MNMEYNPEKKFTMENKYHYEYDGEHRKNPTDADVVNIHNININNNASALSSLASFEKRFFEDPPPQQGRQPPLLGRESGEDEQ